MRFQSVCVGICIFGVCVCVSLVCVCVCVSLVCVCVCMLIAFLLICFSFCLSLSRWCSGIPERKSRSYWANPSPLFSCQTVYTDRVRSCVESRGDSSRKTRRDFAGLESLFLQVPSFYSRDVPDASSSSQNHWHDDQRWHLDDIFFLSRTCHLDDRGTCHLDILRVCVCVVCVCMCVCVCVVCDDHDNDDFKNMTIMLCHSDTPVINPLIYRINPHTGIQLLSLLTKRRQREGNVFFFKCALVLFVVLFQ